MIIQAMMPKSTIVLSVAFMLFTSFAATAKDDTLPRIDVQGNCTRRIKSAGDLATGLQVSIASCVRSELEARDALVAAWKDIPPSYKAECIQPKDYSASYIEWIACLEMRIDLKSVRSKQNN